MSPATAPQHLGGIEHRLDRRGGRSGEVRSARIPDHPVRADFQLDFPDPVTPGGAPAADMASVM